MSDQNTNEEKKKSSFNNFPKPKGTRFNFNFYWVYALVVFIIIAVQLFDYGNHPSQTTMTKFTEWVKSGDVDKVVIINKEVANIYIKKSSLSKDEFKNISHKAIGNSASEGPHFEFTIADAASFDRKLDEIQKDFPDTQKVNVVYSNNDRNNWESLVNWFFLILIIIFVYMFLIRRMGGGGGGSQIFNIGKSKATLFDKDLHVKVTFNDVAGLEEAKVEVMEIVDFLKTPKKYTQLGGKIPRGALLVGPPGTGKTLLAKAVAGEAQVPFFSLSGSDFVEMFVGVGASRVRDLFRQAKEKAPSIIFIDEIDAIGRARGKQPSFSANDERESTLNQLLTEMDGFGSNSGVIILAATNRADILDRALLRPGRFDRQIYVELPDLNGRKEIFKVHAKPLKLDPTIDLDFLAKQTPGFSGADIANLCNEAALIAARYNKTAIQQQDFLDAVDRIVGGLEKKNKIITVQEKKVIAYHESGHAAVSWLLEHTAPLVKVTIVPRGNSLGAAWYLPEERQITTTEQILDEICAALGGRAAEFVTFGAISTGALSDLEKITKQAYACVAVFGLNDKIGNISYYDSSGNSDYSFTKPYSEKTAELIDQEVKKMVDVAYQRTIDLLQKHRSELDQLAATLLEKEVIYKEDLERIFGKRKWEKEEVLSNPNQKSMELSSSTPRNGALPSGYNGTADTKTESNGTADTKTEDTSGPATVPTPEPLS